MLWLVNTWLIRPTTLETALRLRRIRSTIHTHIQMVFFFCLCKMVKGKEAPWVYCTCLWTWWDLSDDASDTSVVHSHDPTDHWCTSQGTFQLIAEMILFTLSACNTVSGNDRNLNLTLKSLWFHMLCWQHLYELAQLCTELVDFYCPVFSWPLTGVCASDEGSGGATPLYCLLPISASGNGRPVTDGAHTQYFQRRCSRRDALKLKHWAEVETSSSSLSNYIHMLVVRGETRCTWILLLL